MEPARTTFDPAVLRSLMEAHFDLNGIRTLCFDLQIDFDNLEGTRKTDKVQGLILYCVQAGRLPHLLAQCNKERPLITWPTLPSPLAEPEPPPITMSAVRYHFLALGIVMSVLLITLTLTGDSRQTAVSYPIAISSFTVKEGHAPTTLVPVSETIPVTANNILTIHALLPISTSSMTDLQFTWYTCQGGSQPVHLSIDNNEFLYTAPAQPGEDCIRLLLSQQDDLLAQAELFIVVTK
ncbi:MAG: hypothetical protein R3E31_27005 [Chloroflexota bacterium]